VFGRAAGALSAAFGLAAEMVIGHNWSKAFASRRVFDGMALRALA
jgi:hypothetical protein